MPPPPTTAAPVPPAPSAETPLRALLPDLLLAAACAVGLVVVAFQAFAPATAAPGAAAVAIGKVEERQNDVRRRSQGQLAWDPLRRGAAVHVDDAVYAGEDSQALLVLEDGARIVLDESSLVIVRPLPASPTQPDGPAVAVEVVRGGARGVSGDRPLSVRAGGTEVRMAAGGELRIRESASGAAVEVARGSITLASGGRTVSVGAGQRADAPREGVASIQELGVTLQAPGPAAILRVREGQALALAFTWSAPAPGECETEISDRPDFSTVVKRWRTARGAYQHPGLGTGVFHWRVRCGDARSEERSFSIVEDVPPVVLAPREGEVVDLSQRPELASRWTALRDEEAYELQLAADGDFTQPAAVARSARAAVEVPMALPEGRYCLRVRASGASRGDAPWSTARCFRTITRPILDAPRVFEPVRETVPPVTPAPSQGAWLWNLILPTAHAAPAPKSALVLRWEKIPGAAAYVLEISEDRDFKKVIVRERVPETYFRWDHIARRDYWWRVRGVDAAGREGQLSERVKIGSEVAPPTLASPAAGARLELAPPATVTLKWNGTAVFASYRVELASDAAFSQGVETREVTEPRLAITPARAGAIFWRVSGVDLVGQSTEPSEVRSFTLAPSAPEPLGPTRVGASTAEELISLAWSPRPVARYEVELLPEGGTTPVRAVAAAAADVAPQTRLAAGRAGRYAWRVRGLEPQTPWSAAQPLEIVPRAPVPVAPEDGARLIEGEEPLLEWDAVPLADVYELELTFADGSKRVEQLATPSFAAGVLGRGAYTWSVRAVGGGTFRSDPSPTLAFAIEAPPAPVEVGLAAAALAPRLSSPSTLGPRSMTPRDRWRLSASATVVSNFGGILSPAPAAEVTWLPARFDGRWGAQLRASAFSSQLRFDSERGRDVEADLWAVPVELLAVGRYDLGTLELSAGVGPILRWIQGEVRLLQGPRFGQGALELGGVVRARAAHRLGRGSVFVELGSALTSTSDGLLITSPLVVDLGAGYRWEVW